MAAQLWHKAPFVRLLVALMAGILLQWHLQLPLVYLLTGIVVSLLIVVVYSFSTIKLRYRLSMVNGIAVVALFIESGALLVWFKDVRNDPAWAGKIYKPGEYIVATIQEPLVEKTNSYKATARFTAITRYDSIYKTTGDLILYF